MNALSTKSPTPESTTPPVGAAASSPATAEASAGADKSETEYQRIIAEFQPKNLCDSINLFVGLQKESSACKSSVEATRLLDINVEHIKQYRGQLQHKF